MAGVTVTMGPATVNITGVRANDRNLMSVTVKDGAGNAVDLTGLTPAAQARQAATDPDPAPLTAVIEITDALSGQMNVRWPGAEVFTLLAGQPSWVGVWDLQLDSVAEDPITICAGTFAAVIDVTRP